MTGLLEKMFLKTFPPFLNKLTRLYFLFTALFFCGGATKYKYKAMNNSEEPPDESSRYGVTTKRQIKGNLGGKTRKYTDFAFLDKTAGFIF